MFMYIHTYAVMNISVVNGNWSSWRLGPCSKTCGGGIHKYTRVCDNPEPSCGGKECEGHAVYSHKKKCNDFCCPGMIMLCSMNILSTNT